MSNDRAKRLFRISNARSVESEVDDEVRFHIQTGIDELMLAGLSHIDAESVAVREFGNLGDARRQLASIDRRRARRGAWREWIAAAAQDARFSLRALRARPTFTITTLLTLALGIGGNAAIYSVVYSVLLKPLPFKQPDRLVHLWEVFESKVDSRSEASYPDYLDCRARNHVFSDLAGYHGSGYLLGTDRAVVVPGAKSTWNFFNVLGVQPMLGRSFLRGEDEIGAPRVALLSYGIWQTQFAGDARIVGRPIVLDGARHHHRRTTARFSVCAARVGADLDAHRSRADAAAARQPLAQHRRPSARRSDAGPRIGRHVSRHARSGARISRLERWARCEDRSAAL